MKCKFRAVNPKTNAEQVVEVDLEPGAVLPFAEMFRHDEGFLDLLTPHYPADMLMIGGTFEVAASKVN
ncbi:hypothetical protein [Tardiphaga sp.]|uniref:hypothetical protein n=1 Tax=Tardiphaga sp. TaxID=1926292 RepID=UPI00261638F3|nr:hypothetical protein [Tardiphaga sp.]MDB5616599.1 hypothetical protein [Tardiphaga sp.]